MARAALFILIAVATALLVYLLIAPHVLAPGATPNAADATSVAKTSSATDLSHAPSGDSGTPENGVSSAPHLDVPRTSAQRQHDDLEAKRGPFYDWIRKNMQSVLVGWQPSSADAATLDLYLAQNNPDTVPWLVQNVVAPFASQNGFNHVRFYLPNASSVDHWRLDSETSIDETGVWNTFRK